MELKYVINIFQVMASTVIISAHKTYVGMLKKTISPNC